MHSDDTPQQDCRSGARSRTFHEQGDNLIKQLPEPSGGDRGRLGLRDLIG
jgi:hypothetical protein